MTVQNLIIDKMPTPEEFYAKYWCKRPFVVRGGVSENVLDSLIKGDELAGLALEEDVRSRIVFAHDDSAKWTCEHGPFDDDIFEKIDEKTWNLLVQNVERHHPKTASLLSEFNFSPRWLLDDIMVSYSVAGGSVGPHIDNYHVFLIQGKGARRWKLGFEAIEHEDYIEELEIKVLKHGFDGEEVETRQGDVIYIPPRFGHQGVTISEAMTFSIGFLGPSISQLLIEYGHYLSDFESANPRYTGEDLSVKSGGFTLDRVGAKTIQKLLIDGINSEHFNAWLPHFFSTPSYQSDEDIFEREKLASPEKIEEKLRSGATLFKPEQFKFMITEGTNGISHFGIEGEVFEVNLGDKVIVDALSNGQKISFKDVSSCSKSESTIQLLAKIYNMDYLEFVDQ